MKIILLVICLFVFFSTRSQVYDSMKEMEITKQWNESFMENWVGRTLPEFMAKELNGKTYTMNTVKSSKATFMTFWSETCAPCVAEIPNLNRLYDSMKNTADFQFFAVTWGSESRAREAIKKFNLRVPVILTSYEEISSFTRARGLPTSMVLDQNGKIRSILSGGDPEQGKGWNGFELYWKQEIQKVLNGDSLIEESKSINSSSTESEIFFIDTLSQIQSLNDL